jgi:hypothetical protein
MTQRRQSSLRFRVFAPGTIDGARPGTLVPKANPAGTRPASDRLPSGGGAPTDSR